MKTRWLWIDGQAAGPYSDAAILRLVAKGDAGSSTLYFHENCEEWRPLTHLRDDAHTEDLAEIRGHGFTRVEFVAGRTEDECPVCQALHGRCFAIAEAPPIPPPDCTCEPWSLAKLIGHR